MTTLIVRVASTAHTLHNHPENAARIPAIWRVLEQAGALMDLRPLNPVAALPEQIARVHDPRMIAAIRAAAERGDRRLDADTYLTPASYEAALRAAGSCCAAVDAIMGGEAHNAIALVRPPGHHAESRRPGGFCLFNNVAAAVRQAQTWPGVTRVMVVDIDVHHGNGTQEIFYEDDSVLFVSLHLHGRYFYPGTGAIDEVGRGPGHGATLNVPLPPRVGDRGYAELVADVIVPRAEQFQPDLIIVSAGYDAHWQDPLAMGGLSLTGYAHLLRRLKELAEAQCDGRLLVVLEGGYLPEALAYGVLNTVYVLTNRDDIADPLGPMPEPETSVAALRQELQRRHLGR